MIMMVLRMDPDAHGATRRWLGKVMSGGSQVGDDPAKGGVGYRNRELHFIGHCVHPQSQERPYPLLPAFCGTGFAFPLWAVNVPPIFMHDPFATSFQAFP